MCTGPECAENEKSCVSVCPQQALTVTENPAFETIGDYRWTADIIAAAWSMAETGKVPPSFLDSEIGTTDGGFDKLRIRFPKGSPADLRREDISTELLLNRSNDSRAQGQDRCALVRWRYVFWINQYTGSPQQGTCRQGV